jgi:hypothetical protein
MLLCALVWWFSYDHGRQTARTRVARLEAENISLREKVVLLERDLELLSRAQKEAESSQGPAPQEGLAPGAQAELAPAPAAPPKAGAAADDQARGRLTVKLAENKGLFGGRVVLTMVELDSLDQEALVRAHYRDTGRRLAQLMAPGDIFELEVDGEPHQLYLDQIKGSLAFFLIDSMPGGE